MGSFVHLNVHSEYSIYDGLVRLDALIEAAKKDQMPAVALTDRSNLFAAVKFYQAAVRAGIKPILGADCQLLDDVTGQDSSLSRMILLCQNNYKIPD